MNIFKVGGIVKKKIPTTRSHNMKIS